MAQIKSSIVHGRPLASQRALSHEPQKLAYSIAEFSLIAGGGRSLLYEEITKGNLRVRKIGRRTLILHDEGQAWLSFLPVRQMTSSSDKG